MKISEIEEEKNNSSEIIDIHSEKLGEYSQETLIDIKKISKICRASTITTQKIL